MSTPAKKAARRTRLEELAAVAAELDVLEAKVRELAERRDDLLVEARDEDRTLSLRDVAAIGKVSHAWVRKLDARRG
jgi:hypothetical protein